MIPLHVLHVPGADPERDAIVALLVTFGACVHTDPTRKGVMPIWLEALECASADTGRWTAIVQDDADPLPGWEAHLEDATSFSPEPVLGLTHFGSYGLRALEKGVPYGIGRNLVWGGAVAYRQTIVRDLTAYARMIWEDLRYPHDDRLAAAYAMRIGRQTALAARAIFDQPIQASLLGHNTKVRRPATTIANSQGPAWSSIPRAVKVHAAVAKEIAGLARHEKGAGDG